jgi:aspartyl-tRNA synthetase
MTLGGQMLFESRKSMHPYRSHTCGELRKSDAEKTVRLSGWIHNRRDHGGLLFIDLRDHYGLTQLVVPQEAPFHDAIGRLPKETVIRVDGKVVERGVDEKGKTRARGDTLATGDIEVIVSDYEVLGPMRGSDEFDGQLPFSVFPEDEAPEDTRLKFRFLDLRRSQLHANIVLRSRVISSIRRRMTEMGFLEYSTPILTSSSPEGARDYLVPSRVHPGKFYALPQAPQQFKQLLMVAGFDRYFQIAPCFRDEDARADRSPGEFYQLDLEMSFVTQDDVFAAMEKLFTGLFPEFRPDKKMTPAPFPRIPYAEAMLKYGSDKPDLRIPLEIRDASELLAAKVPFFAGKTVRILPVPNCADKSRKFFDTLDAKAKGEGLGGLAWITVQPDGTFKGSLAKQITPEIGPALLSRCGGGPGYAIFFAADADANKLCKVLGGIRAQLGNDLGLVEKDTYRFCWITDFPMYELDEEGKVAFSHNPFSMPQGGLEALNTKNPLEIKAFQYDIVCNGTELSSGAIRNHRPDIMYRAFEIAGYSPDVVNRRFGGMINAFKLGAPPHGGIAPGVDRIVMLLADEKNIREVIAFPMNQRAQDLMMGAPSEVTPKQLKELHIQICEEEK